MRRLSGGSAGARDIPAGSGRVRADSLGPGKSRVSFDMSANSVRRVPNSSAAPSSRSQPVRKSTDMKPAEKTSSKKS